MSLYNNEQNVSFKYARNKHIKLRQLVIPYNMTVKEALIVICDKLVEGDQKLLKILEQHNYRKHVELIKSLKHKGKEKTFSEIDENMLYDMINEANNEDDEKRETKD